MYLVLSALTSNPISLVAATKARKKGYHSQIKCNNIHDILCIEISSNLFH